MQSIKTDIVKPIDKSIIVLSDIDCIGQSIEIDGNNFFRRRRYRFCRLKRYYRFHDLSLPFEGQNPITY